MNQHDLDALGTRAERICRNMSYTACLVRVLAEIVEGTAEYHIKSTDCSTLAYIVVRYIDRLNMDIIKLKSEVDYPPSGGHCTNCKLL